MTLNIYKIIILISAVILCSITIWLGFQNRGSEKLVSQFLSVFVILFGATGTLITLLWGLKEEPKIVEFPAIHILHKENLLPFMTRSDHPIHPINAFIRTSSSFIFQDALKKNKHLYKSAIESDEVLRDFCSEVIFKEIIDQLFLIYNKGWDRQLKVTDALLHQMESSVQYSKPEKSDHISREAFFKNYNLEYIDIRDERPEFVQPDGMDIPPGTKIDFLEAKKFRGFRIRCPFVSISLGVSPASYGGGLFSKEKFPYISAEDQKQLRVVTYVLSMKAEYEPTKLGHPKMQKYREWVAGMFYNIENKFSSKKAWDESKDIYILSRLRKL